MSERIKKIKKQLKAAAPGPWVAVEFNDKCPLPAGVAIAVQQASEPRRKQGTICEMVALGKDGKYSPKITTATAELIADCPENLQWLVTLAEELLEDNRDLSILAKHYIDSVKPEDCIPFERIKERYGL